MPRGFPDGGVPEYARAAAGADPTLTAEYAAFGLSRIDGLGRVAILDVFREGVMGWYGSAPLEVFAYTGGKGFFGGSIIYPLVAPVCIAFERSTIAGDCRLTRRQNVGATGKLGIEIAFFCSGVTAPTMEAILDYTNAAGLGVLLQLRFVTSTGAIQVYNTTGGAYVTIATVGTSDGWVPIKVVVNATTRVYERLLLGQQYYALNQNAANGAGTTPGRLQAQLIGTGVVNAQDRAFVGYYVITTDEP